MGTTIAANRNPTERNAEATVHIAQLDDKVTDALLWELMVQAAPVRHVYIPRDRITGSHFGYGFCEFLSPLDAQYATKILNMLPLFSKRIRISQSTVDRRSQDVGANLFIGNLVEEVDEKLLHDAFSAFGPLIDAPYIMRDPQTQESKRYAFVKYGSFEHSDTAIAAMDGQYICNSPISVQYAFKKDSGSRERHGSQAERILAAKGTEARRASNTEFLRPHTLFSDRPASQTAAAAQAAHRATPAAAPLPPGMVHSHPSPQSAYAHPPQPMFMNPSQQFPTQGYPPGGAAVPLWQRSAHMPYQNNQQATYNYPQSSYPQYAPYGGQPPQQTANIGWSANRSYGGGSAQG